MRIIPLHSLVLMVGPTSQYKTELVASKFQPYEIESCEKLASEIYGDPKRLENADLLLHELHRRTETKLSLGERVVIDAPNLAFKERMAAAKIGLKYGCPTYYVVTDQQDSVDGIEATKQFEQFRQLKHEILLGDHLTNVIDMAIDDFRVVNKIHYKGLLDHLINVGYRGLCVVPDVHGMVESLKQAIEWAKSRGLFLVFLGDILDYGPQSVDCVYLVYDLIMRSQAILAIGNHERKIERWLDQQRKLVQDAAAIRGKTRIRLSEGNKATTMLIEAMSQKERAKFEGRFAAMMAFARHHWLIGEDLMVVHGAAEPEMFEMDDMRLTRKYESRALFGEVDQNNPTGPDGYPNRIYEWVDRIPSGKLVIVGHDIRSTVKPLHMRGKLGGQAYFCDTGSGKGGRLTSADIIFREGHLNVQNFTAH